MATNAWMFYHTCNIPFSNQTSHIVEANVQATLESSQKAAANGSISAAALENLTCWLTEDRYADYRDPIIQHVKEEKWQQLDDAFWTIIPFGTGGRRGRMYPFLSLIHI